MLRARVPRVAGVAAGAYTLTVDAASYSVTGQDVALIKASVVQVDPASYSVTGQNVDLIYTPVGGYTLAVDPASYTVTGQNVTLTYTPAGSGATPAQIWAYELLPGISAGDMLIALYQNACPTAAQNAAAVLAAMNATPPGVDVRKVNGYTVDGSGTQADPWGPV